jgi:hypothetical protein
LAIRQGCGSYAINNKQRAAQHCSRVTDLLEALAEDVLLALAYKRLVTLVLQNLCKSIRYCIAQASMHDNRPCCRFPRGYATVQTSDTNSTFATCHICNVMTLYSPFAFFLKCLTNSCFTCSALPGPNCRHAEADVTINNCMLHCYISLAVRECLQEQPGLLCDRAT